MTAKQSKISCLIMPFRKTNSDSLLKNISKNRGIMQGDVPL